MTSLDLYSSSLRLIGVVAAGETPNPSEAKDATDALNALLANWNAQHLLVYTITNRQHNLSASTGSYTIGTGGTFDVPRPVKIESAGIIQSNGLRSPLELVDSRRWAATPEKTADAVQPLILYNDNQFPLATLYLWPRPKCSTATQLDLSVWDELDALTYRYYTDLVIGAGNNKTATSAMYPFTAADVGAYIDILGGTGFTYQTPPLRAKILSVLAGVATFDVALGTVGSTGGQALYSQAMDMPPGYYKALRYCLAMELCAEYGRPVPQEVMAIAIAAKNELMGLNVSNAAAQEDPPPQQQPAQPAQQQ